MRLRLLNLLTTLSLVLCVAFCVLWVRTYFATENVAYSTREVYWSVEFRRGELLWTHTDWTKRLAIVEDLDDHWHYENAEPEPR